MKLLLGLITKWRILEIVLVSTLIMTVAFQAFAREVLASSSLSAPSLASTTGLPQGPGSALNKQVENIPAPSIEPAADPPTMTIASQGAAQEQPVPPAGEDAPLETFLEQTAAAIVGGKGLGPPPPPAVASAAPAWLPQGPGPTLNGQVENVVPNNEVAGGIHTVAAHPTDPDILYVGAVNGGIWRTSNATAANPNWTPLTDDQLSLSIGALEFDPADPDTLLAGIGRFTNFNRRGGGLFGLLLTNDGGNNWTQISDPILLGENFSGVAIRGNLLLAASNNFFGVGGLYRSNDGGSSWNLVSGSNGLPIGAIFDLVGDPGDPNRFYASVGSTGIFRSDDGGATWTNISIADATLNPIISTGANNNTEMAVANSGRLYAGVVVAGQPQYIGFTDNPTAAAPIWTVMDLPRTIDGTSGAIANASNTSPIIITSALPHGLRTGGQARIAGVTGNTAANGDSFVTVINNTQFSLNGSTGNGAYTGGGTWTDINGLNPGGQGATNFAIVADPGNSNIVYVGGDRQDFPFPNFIGANDFSGRLFRGDTTVTPTGAIPSPQWDHLTHSNAIAAIPGGGTASSSSPHADAREMVFDTQGDLIQVDDGGIYRRTFPANNTGDWFSINGDIQPTEFHDIAYDTVSNIIFGGTQDTGTPEQVTPGGTTWNSVSTADGGDVAVDIISVPGMSIRYSSNQRLQNFRMRTCDALNVCGAAVFPALTLVGGGAALVPQFKTPVELNAVDPTRLIIGGANSTYESLDQGSTITEVGPGIPVNRPDAVAYGGRQGGVANLDVLYVGSGTNVFTRTAAAPAPLVASASYPGGTVRDIVLDPDDWMTAYVIDSNQVFVTSNAGTSWTDITGNLADVDLRSIEFISGTTEALLVGGRNGVFWMPPTIPGGWTELGSGLPRAVAFDLDYDPADDFLVVGTLGRGAWSLSDASEALLLTDLSITKTDDPDPVVAGTNLTYQITVENISDIVASSITLTDTLPTEVTYITDTVGCGEVTTGTLVCNLGNLAGGDAIVFDVTGQVAPDVVFNAGGPTTITNTAVVFSGNPDDDPSDNTTVEVTQVVAEADLEILSFEAVNPPTEVLVGEEVIITLRKDITNNGPSGPMNVQLTLHGVAPPGSFITPTMSVINEPALGLGEIRPVTETFTINCTEFSTHTFTFTNQITPHDPADTDPDLSNNSASVDLVVQCVLPVAINIKPGSFPNSIDPDSKGVIPVAVLTTLMGEYGLPDDFDATTIDPLSVRFGLPDEVWNETGGAFETHNRGHIKDSKELDETTMDGDLDMVLHFRTQETGIAAGDVEMCIKGEFLGDDGNIHKFFGCDSIRTVPQSLARITAGGLVADARPDTRQ